MVAKALRPRKRSLYCLLILAMGAISAISLAVLGIRVLEMHSAPADSLRAVRQLIAMGTLALDNAAAKWPWNADDDGESEEVDEEENELSALSTENATKSLKISTAASQLTTTAER